MHGARWGVALQHFGEGDKAGVPSKERKGKGEGGERNT